MTIEFDDRISNEFSWDVLYIFVEHIHDLRFPKQAEITVEIIKGEGAFRYDMMILTEDKEGEEAYSRLHNVSHKGPAIFNIKVVINDKKISYAMHPPA